MPVDRNAEPARRPVFSLWSWGLLAPFLMTAYGGFDYATTLPEQLTGFGIAVVAQILLGAAFLGAAAVERRIRSITWHVAWVVAALLAMSILRPLLLTGLQELLGVPPVPTSLALRFAMNLVVLGGSVVVVHAWLRAADRSRANRAELRRVLRSRTADVRATELATDRVVEEFSDAVARPVREALEGARVEPFEAAAQAERLRLVAHDVVRPLSHHVFATGMPAIPAQDASTTAIERVADRRPTLLPDRVVPAPFWAPIAVFLFVTFPLLPNGYDLGGAVLRAALAGAIGLAGNVLVGLLPLRRGWPAVLALGLGYGVVGVGTAWAYLVQGWIALAPASEAVGVGAVLWIYLPLGYTVIALVIALAHSLHLDALASERTLTRALAFADEQAAESRARYEATADDVARVLHHLVQGEIIATSLQLRMGHAGAPEVEDLVQRVGRILREPAAARAVERTGQEVRDAANAAIVSWSRVMEITSEAATPDCWRWLAEHPDATALFLDANAEALTNASRHAAAPTVDLRLERIADGVRMLARNPGRLGGGAGDGVGIEDLRRRGAVVTLEQESPGTVLLTVDITEPDSAV